MVRMPAFREETVCDERPTEVTRAPFESCVQINRQPQSCCKDGLVRAGNSAAVSASKTLNLSGKLCFCSSEIGSHRPKWLRQSSLRVRWSMRVTGGLVRHQWCGRGLSWWRGSKVYLLIYAPSISFDHELWVTCRKDWDRWQIPQKLVSFDGWLGSLRQIRHPVLTHCIVVGVIQASDSDVSWRYSMQRPYCRPRTPWRDWGIEAKLT